MCLRCSTRWQALYDTFSLFGNILSCKVATDDAGESKGYGYVHYETGVSANMAITKINGMLIAGKQVGLCVSARFFVSVWRVEDDQIYG